MKSIVITFLCLCVASALVTASDVDDHIDSCRDRHLGVHGLSCTNVLGFSECILQPGGIDEESHKLIDECNAVVKRCSDTSQTVADFVVEECAPWDPDYCLYRQDLNSCVGDVRMLTHCKYVCGRCLAPGEGLCRGEECLPGQQLNTVSCKCFVPVTATEVSRAQQDIKKCRDKHLGENAINCNNVLDLSECLLQNDEVEAESSSLIDECSQVHKACSDANKTISNFPVEECAPWDPDYCLHRQDPASCVGDVRMLTHCKYVCGRCWIGRREMCRGNNCPPGEELNTVSCKCFEANFTLNIEVPSLPSPEIPKPPSKQKPSLPDIHIPPASAPLAPQETEDASSQDVKVRAPRTGDVLDTA